MLARAAIFKAAPPSEGNFVDVLRWDHRATQADAIQGSSLDDPAENTPNHHHLLLVHHVNLSGLVVSVMQYAR